MSNYVDKVKLSFTNTVNYSSSNSITYDVDDNGNLINPDKEYNTDMGKILNSINIFINNFNITNNNDYIDNLKITGNRERIIDITIPEGVTTCIIDKVSFYTYIKKQDGNYEILYNNYYRTSYNFTIGLIFPTTFSSLYNYYDNNSTVSSLHYHVSYIKFTNNDDLNNITHKFGNFYFLEKIDYSPVFKNSNNYYIWSNMFYNCISLQELNNFCSNIVIDSGTFYNCPCNLKNLNILSFRNYSNYQTYPPFKNCNIENITFNNSNITFIPSYMFYNSNIKNITLNSSNINKINPNAFANSNINSIDYSNSSVTELKDSEFANCINLNNIVLPNNLTKIGSYCFQNTSIERINIPESVNELGSYIFYGCNKLSNISIMNVNITEIPDGMFYGCTSLKNFNFNNLTKIKKYSFKNCGIVNLDLSLNLNLDIIEEGAFAECKKLSSVNIPPRITELSTSLFENCYNLSNIDLNNVTIIGARCFAGCKNLVSIDLSNITSILINAFLSCTKLSSIDLSNIENLGDSVFYGCTSLKTIYNLNDDIEYLPLLIFYNCTSLENISVSKNLVTIGEQAFENCSSLKSFTIRNVEESSLKTINNKAFLNCINLEEFTFPDSIESIGSEAFHNTNIWNYDPGSNLITIYEDSFDYYIEIDRNGNIDENGVLIYTYNLIGINFNNNEYIKKVIIDETVYDLPEECFLNCYNLEEVVIGSNMTNIPKRAFFNCTSLRKVTFPSNSKFYIDEHIIKDNRELNSNVYNNFGFIFTGDRFNFERIVDVENSEYVYKCNYTYVNPDPCIEYYVTKRDSTFFYASITSIYDSTIGSSLSIFKDDYLYIGDEAFSNCKSLTTFEYDNDKILYFQTINDKAFYGCNSLIEFGNIENRIRITKIKNKCFYNCTSLNKLNIKFTMIQLYKYENVGYDLPTLNIIRNYISIGLSPFKNTALYKEGKFKVLFYTADNANDKDYHNYMGTDMDNKWCSTFFNLSFEPKKLKMGGDYINTDNAYLYNIINNIDGDIILCKNGYHYYKNFFDVFNNYKGILYSSNVFYYFTINNNLIYAGINNYDRKNFKTRHDCFEFNTSIQSSNNSNNSYYSTPLYQYYLDSTRSNIYGFTVVTDIENGDIDISGTKDSKHVTNQMCIKNIYDTSDIIKMVCGLDEEGE